jgi:DNA-binding response OmpR family regulator
VDATIRRLRRAINVGSSVDLLRTVRAEGYALDPLGVDKARDPTAPA